VRGPINLSLRNRRGISDLSNMVPARMNSPRRIIFTFSLTCSIQSGWISGLLWGLYGLLCRYPGNNQGKFLQKDSYFSQSIREGIQGHRGIYLQH